MTRKLGVFTIVIVMILSLIPFAQSADAATVYKGTFEGLTYDETEVNGTTEYTVSGVTIRNSAGKTSTFKINSTTYYFINNTKTTINGFKYGMEVEVSVNLRTIKELRGKSEIEEGTISQNSKEVYGSVASIDPNGMYIRVKPSTGREREYYVNSETTYFKGNSHVDLSTLYEGDRVKMTFSSPESFTVDEMEIIQTGTRIENLYKAQLRTVNVTGNRFTVVNSQRFTDWEFGTSSNKKLTTFTINAGTSIYVGNKKITKNQLKNYRESDIYYVTLKQFSNEIVKKIIVLENNERTYFDELTLVNPTAKYIKLKEAGTMYYHNGSILVRNGRLVEGTTLVGTGSAFVLTDGVTKSTNTHVVNVMNDGFLSANLASHDLYFGKLAAVDDKKYLVELTNFTQLQQEGQQRNFWKNTGATKLTLSYSNNTVPSVSVGISGTVLATSLAMHLNKVGFFYVKDGHIQAVHLLPNDATESTEIFTGMISELSVQKGTAGAKGIDATGEMVLENVTQWTSAGAWLETGRMEDVQLNQVLIIKDSKRISAEQLAPGNRVVIFTDDALKTKIVLVNE